MTEQTKRTPPQDGIPSSASSAHNPTPGALRGEVRLTVQSRYAQRLIVGRAWTPEKPAIIGLVGFADRLRVIWHAARADDPYADWWLIKIDAALQRARVCFMPAASLGSRPLALLTRSATGSCAVSGPATALPAALPLAVYPRW